MKKMLKKGTTVTIYTDPVDCRIREGDAKLIRRISHDRGDGNECWSVHFLTDPPDCTFERWVGRKRA